MADRNPLKRAFVTALGVMAALLVAGLLGLPDAPPSATTAGAAKDGPLALINANVFDGEKWLDKTTLIIDAGRVVALGADAAVPDNAQTMDLEGHTIVPGLIDAHTHTVGDALRDSLRFGVTVNLDMFAPASVLPDARTRRAELGAVSRADLFSAGVLATVDGGHGTQYGVPVDLVDGPDSAADWVARRIKEGSDFIKLVYMPYQQRLPSLDLATASALIRAAHDTGVLAVAHISSGQGARDMLDAGVDGLVHVWADTEVTDDFLADAKAADLFVIPTLAVYATTDQSGEGAQLAGDERLSSRLTDLQISNLRADFGFRIPTMTLASALENTRRLHAAGVTVLAGSDAPNPGTTHGASLHHELHLLTRAGMSPTEALMAATSQSAERFEIGTRGRLVAGARADFVVLNADPREDIQATRDIDLIFKNGREADVALGEAGKPSDAEPIVAGRIGTFSEDNVAPDGYIWTATDDRSFGGQSVAELSHVPAGDAAPDGALRVDVAVKPGFSFPWAGFYFGPTDEAPRSMRDMDSLTLALRGTPGRYRVMFFNAGSVGAPPTVNVDITSSWQDIRIRMADVPGLNLGKVAGFAVVAGPSPVEAYLELGRAELRQK